MYGLNKKEEIRNYVAGGIELMSTVYVPVVMLVAALSSLNPPFPLQQHISACLSTSDDNSGGQFIIRIWKYTFCLFAGYKEDKDISYHVLSGPAVKLHHINTSYSKI